jgi:hypothetical protein
MVKRWREEMVKNPIYLEHKQVPDEGILTKVKMMIGEGKGPKQMKEKLHDTSLYTIRRYYSKVRRGIW